MPKERRVLDLQMQMFFDPSEQKEPMVAVRNYFCALDAETDEILRVSNNSDPAGGLYGVQSTQVRLLFEIPVSEITVWMWGDSTSQTMVPVEIEDGCYFLTLDDHSAHYRVDVFFEPYDGIQYDATYVFDVEVPK